MLLRCLAPLAALLLAGCFGRDARPEDTPAPTARTEPVATDVTESGKKIVEAQRSNDNATAHGKAAQSWVSILDHKAHTPPE